MISERAAFPSDSASRSWLGTAAIAAAIGIAYFMAARLGLALLAKPGVAIFWPAAGIAVGALIALGPSARLPLTAGVVVATAVANIMIGRNAWVAIFFGLVNAGQSLLTAWLVERRFGRSFRLENVSQVLWFLVASAIGAAVAAACAAVALNLAEPTSPLASVWRLWFASCLLGIITVAPLLIGLGAAVRDLPTRREMIEGAAGLVTLAALSAFLISLPEGPWATALPVALVLPLLLWFAVRCRPVFAAGAAFIVALAVIWSTTFNVGHFGDPGIPLADRILAAQSLVLAAALLVIILAALFAERRLREAELKQGKESLQLALDGAELGAFSADLVTGQFTCDERVARIHGHKGQPTTIRESRRFVHPDDLVRIDTALAEAVRAHGVWRAEYRVVHPPDHPHGGKARWVVLEGSVVRNSHGKPVRLLGVTRDITHRKLAEQALAERNVQLALAGKAALVGSYAYDTDTERMQVSDGYVAIHGLPERTEEIPRNQWRAGVHPEDLSRLDVLRNQAFDERRREYNAEYRIVRSGGEIRWIESRSFISYDSDGHPRRVVGVNIDVTDRKALEEHKNVLIAELDHRVKNVLAVVSVIASRTQETSNSMSDFVTALDGRIKSMATTHELLSYRRWQGIPLAELVRRELAPYATAGNTSIDGSDNILSTEASQAVAMVLHELATNAAKFGALSAAGGHVSVRWSNTRNGQAQGSLCVWWEESGGPDVAPEGRSGFGTSVIRDLIPYELGGTVDLVYSRKGVCCKLEIPSHWLSNSDLHKLDNADATAMDDYEWDRAGAPVLSRASRSSNRTRSSG